MTTTATGANGPSHQDFDQFRQLRRELAELADELAGVTGALGQDHLVKAAREVSVRVSEDTFTILVMGEFNAGKSTTVNAMLGEKVLPASANPTTAVLSVVRWGEQPAVTLYAADPGSPDGLDRTPVPVPVEELSRHIVVGTEGDGNTPWGLAELRWPLELCRNGVDIVDSPGLNESPAREVVTMDFVSRADAVVFVLSALQALKGSERSFVDEHLRVFRHDNIFFLVNRINQVDEDEVDMVLRAIRDQARSNWDIRAERVLPVDAAAALRGRRQNRPALLEESGLPEIERSLERFLTTERGRLKIVPPALEIQRIAADARTGIEDSHTLLDADLDKLNAEYEKQRGPLEALGRDRMVIDRTIENHLTATRTLVEESARACLTRAAAQCAAWASEVERQHKVTLNVFKARKNLEAATKEVSEGLGERIQQHVTDWRDGELTELVQARTSDLEAVVGEDLDTFAHNLAEIRLSFLEAAGARQPQQTPSALERGASFAAGILVDPGSALVGAQFGFKEMLKGVLPQLALAAGIGLLGFGPGALFLTLFGTGVARSLIKMDRLNEQVVSNVASAAADRLREEAPAAARRIAEKVHQQLSGMREETDRRLAADVAAVAESVQFALRRRDESRHSAEEAKRGLRARRVELDGIDQRAAAVLRRWTSGD